jgi:hypothetical protein
MVRLLVVLLVACASSTPPPKAAPVEDQTREAPPPGPTRTSVKAIAKKLAGRCIGGGWIARWRSQGHLDVARPKLFIKSFEDRTGQNIDPMYLTNQTEAALRLGGVFELVAESGTPHFEGKGTLLRLNEGGGRTSYTATLDMIDAASQKNVQTCEATVEGEM